MSLVGSFFPEFRPLFRTLEDPFSSSPSPSRALSRNQSRDLFSFPSPRDLFYAPFSSFPTNQQAQEFFRSSNPSFDLQDNGDHYILESELPGYKKEDVEVHVGDEGQSVTVEGRSYRRTKTGGVKNSENNVPKSPAPAQATSNNNSNTAAAANQAKDQAVTTTNDQTTVQKRGEPTSESTFSSSFKRTLWLPEPTDPDGNRVTGQLVDGVLTLNIPKLARKEEEARDPRGVRVAIQ